MVHLHRLSGTCYALTRPITEGGREGGACQEARQKERPAVKAIEDGEVAQHEQIDVEH